MRKVVLLEHVSLDGFVAGPNGEMDWIRVNDEELWNYVAGLTAAADMALFGRVTYEMMEGYWPTAADAPGADRHAVDHAAWVNPATKLVFSRTLESVKWGTWDNAVLVKDDLPGEVRRLKQESGKNLLLIGSINLAQEFMRRGLIDEYHLNINPVILGAGRRLFEGLESKINLELVETLRIPSGVIAAHYRPA